MKHCLIGAAILAALLLTSCRSQEPDPQTASVPYEETISSEESSTPDSSEASSDVPESGQEETVPDSSSEERTADSSLEDPFGEEALIDEDALIEDRDAFYAEPLPQEVIDRMLGYSYPVNGMAQVKLEDLSYLHLYYIDFNGNSTEGEMVCHSSVAEDLLDIFYELYEIRYPIQSIHLVDDYEANDELSMQVNNTYCFCYRWVEGENYLSSHSYGMSVDLNPIFNPMVNLYEGEVTVFPRVAKEYADRTKDFEHKITHEDPAYLLFKEHGFSWGGDWQGDRQDYMHFEKAHSQP